MGKPMSVGTGLMKLLHKPPHYVMPPRRELIFDKKEFSLQSELVEAYAESGK